ncbi:MAG TPA: hypothetical protein VGM79_18605 [Streptosporangiaceae bacterium]
MNAHSARTGPWPLSVARQTGRRLRRLGALAAAVISGLVASAVIVPSAFASVPVEMGGASVPGEAGRLGPGSLAHVPASVVLPAHARGAVVTPAHVPGSVVRVVAASGMLAWQVILIALGAAVLGAATAALISRARSGRRASATAGA